jgi:hypothetical protein
LQKNWQWKKIFEFEVIVKNYVLFLGFEIEKFEKTWLKQREGIVIMSRLADGQTDGFFIICVLFSRNFSINLNFLSIFLLSILN